MKFTEEEIKRWKAEIDKMSHEELATIYRYERLRHPIFTLENDEIYQYFEDAFNKFGGMTPQMSKYLNERHNTKLL